MRSFEPSGKYSNSPLTSSKWIYSRSNPRFMLLLIQMFTFCNSVRFFWFSAHFFVWRKRRRDSLLNGAQHSCYRHNSEIHCGISSFIIRKRHDNHWLAAFVWDSPTATSKDRPRRAFEWKPNYSTVVAMLFLYLLYFHMCPWNFGRKRPLWDFHTYCWPL